MARREKNYNWRLNCDSNGKYAIDNAQLSVLMDLRDELQGVQHRLLDLNRDILRALRRRSAPRKPRRFAKLRRWLRRFRNARGR